MPLHVSRAMTTARRMSGMYAPDVLRLSQRRRNLSRADGRPAAGCVLTKPGPYNRLGTGWVLMDIPTAALSLA